MYYLIRCRSSSVWIVMTAYFSFFLRWILPLLVHRYFQYKSFLFWLAWASKCFLRLVRFSLIKTMSIWGSLNSVDFSFFLELYMLILVFLAMNLIIILGFFLSWSVLGFRLSLCTTSIASLVIVVSIFLRTCGIFLRRQHWFYYLALVYHGFPSFVFGHTVVVQLEVKFGIFSSKSLFIFLSWAFSSLRWSILLLIVVISLNILESWFSRHSNF